MRCLDTIGPKERLMPDSLETFRRTSAFAAPRERLWAFHARPGAFEALVPPGDPVKLVRDAAGLRDGERVEIRVGRWPLRMRWLAEYRDVVEGERFTDVQVSGPFARWEHQHLMSEGPDGGCVLEDRITYAVPLGALGRWLGGWFIRRKLQRLFDHRHRVTRHWVECRGAEGTPEDE